MRYYLDENNSGGSFWLNRGQYDRLIAAGWQLDQDKIAARRSDTWSMGDDFGATDRFADRNSVTTLTADRIEKLKATIADRASSPQEVVTAQAKLYAGQVPYSWRRNLYFEADSIRDAIESFEGASGEDFFAEGCNCCGVPFSMSGGDEYMSGSDARREVIRPW